VNGAGGGVTQFRIADTFTDSLARLSGQEQKAVKTTAFDLQLDPATPGMRFHKLDRAKDPNFWSVRVNADIRLIVHRTGDGLLLCYVGHHDDAYAWAARRRIERHPETGAAQLVEVRESVEEVTVQPPPGPPMTPATAPPLFADISEHDLLRYGVPAEWIDTVRGATEETLFDLADHLPQEAAEALLELATGGEPAVPEVAPAETDPFAHPDAQRRFRVLTNVEELERALEYPWERWTVFLHPEQRRLVEREYGGPARIAGSAGTGKTIVALHRAVHLARRHPEARVLLTTFSKALANALKVKLERLAGNEPDVVARVVIRPVTAIAYELYTDAFGQPTLASDAQIRSYLEHAAAEDGDQSLTPHFLFGEWCDVIDAWQIGSWEAYRDVARLGRKTRLGVRQREALWRIFSGVRDQLRRRRLVTWSGVFGRVTAHLLEKRIRPFDFAVVDEAQDMGVAEIRLLAAIGGGRPDGLFLTGDLGQRIFQQPFSWKALRVDVRGRSHLQHAPAVEARHQRRIERPLARPLRDQHEALELCMAFPFQIEAAEAGGVMAGAGRRMSGAEVIENPRQIRPVARRPGRVLPVFLRHRADPPPVRAARGRDRGFEDAATPGTSTVSLHDALRVCRKRP